MLEITLPPFEELIEIIKHEQKIDSIYKSNRHIVVDLSFNDNKYIAIFKTIMKKDSISVLLDTFQPQLYRMWATNFNLNKLSSPIDIALLIYQNTYMFSERPEALEYHFDEQELFKVYIKCLEIQEYSENPAFLFSSIRYVFEQTINVWVKKLLSEELEITKKLSIEELFDELYKLEEPLCKKILLNVLNGLIKTNKNDEIAK